MKCYLNLKKLFKNLKKPVELKIFVINLKKIKITHEGL